MSYSQGVGDSYYCYYLVITVVAFMSIRVFRDSLSEESLIVFIFYIYMSGN